MSGASPPGTDGPHAGAPRLADIIDPRAVQSLMDDLYEVAHIPMSVIDREGNVLAGVGWQDICTKFHRVNPESRRHCVESDTELSAGVPAGEFRLYRCKNNMWDVATPIMVEGEPVGSVFSGQFFFEGEPLDYELFRAQARRYDFDEAAYVAALEAVPRLSRATLDAAMSFFLKLADMLSQLGHGNAQLARWLAERDALTESLRQNERDLNRAQAVAQTGSWRLDVRRNELIWSAQTHRLFGVPPGTPMTYETFLAAVHPDDRERVDREWAAALQGAPYEVEHRILVDGAVHWVRERAELEFDPAGKVTGGFGTVQDVTARKQAERELREAERRLEELNQSLERRVEERTAEVRAQADQLRALAAELTQVEQRERRRLAAILHDHIQQLLVAAKLQLGLVKRDPAGANGKGALRAVESLLEEAIAAARSLTVELSPPVLHEAGLGPALVWLAGRLRETSGFQVEVRTESRAEPAADEVRVLLFESVRELLLNAQKHSGTRSARVALDSGGPGWTKVVVEDDGCGFDVAARKAQRARSEGFGLFSIEQRLTFLGGSAVVTSAPGRGTRVELLAPRRERPGSAGAAAAALPRADAPPRRTLTVLLVDDHPILREGVAELLRLEPDIQLVREASDGEEALRLARELRPDVVVMDVNLPGMSGIEATAAFARVLPEARVIGLSMHREADIEAAMLRAGAAAYVTKGGPLEDLISAIRACPVRPAPHG